METVMKPSPATLLRVAWRWIQGIVRMCTDCQWKDKQLSTYKTLVQSLEYQLRETRKNQMVYQEAIESLASEREANSILTEELDLLRKRLQ